MCDFDLIFFLTNSNKLPLVKILTNFGLFNFNRTKLVCWPRINRRTICALLRVKHQFQMKKFWRHSAHCQHHPDWIQWSFPDKSIPMHNTSHNSVHNHWPNCTWRKLCKMPKLNHKTINIDIRIAKINCVLIWIANKKIILR